MVKTQKPLAALTAEDVMSCAVKTIPQEMPLQEAARLLAHEQISGAPVVDTRGRCVGVLSATDFVRWAEKGTKAVHSATWPSYCSDWQVVDLEFLPREEVRCHMSSDLVTAAPTATVTELARWMLDAHIHRVVVIDAERRPVGIVSSTDILAAVARGDVEASLTDADYEPTTFPRK
jgi:CBS-domain-containing membrane protein